MEEIRGLKLKTVFFLTGIISIIKYDFLSLIVNSISGISTNTNII